VSARPGDIETIRIPIGQAAGHQLRGIAENDRGRHWLRWALRWPGWDDEFQEALEEYARMRAPLIWRSWRREQRGEA